MTKRLLTPLAALAALAPLPATAAADPGYCAPDAKAGSARVQLYADARCGGGSMIVPEQGNGDRPDFRRFANFDGRIYDVDDSRSSLAVAAGSCVRVFDGLGYAGEASAILCAPSTTEYFVLSAFDDRVSSMRVCRLDRQDDCSAAGGSSAAPSPRPQPQPQPQPEPQPAPPPQPQPQPQPAPAPAAPPCATGTFQRRYLSSKRPLRKDLSWVRMTWQPRLCLEDGRYTTDSDPVLTQMGPASLVGVGLDLDAPRRLAGGVEYDGRLRQCLPISAGYKGISFGGTGCFTVGSAKIRATVVAGRVRYGFTSRHYRFSGLEYRSLLWTRKVL